MGHALRAGTAGNRNMGLREILFFAAVGVVICLVAALIMVGY